MSCLSFQYPHDVQGVQDSVPMNGDKYCVLPFHVQSGNAVCPWAVDVDMARQVGYTVQVAEEVNCTTMNPQAMMDCLRVADLDDILFAQSKVSNSVSHFGVCVRLYVLICSSSLDMFNRSYSSTGCSTITSKFNRN